MKMLLICIALLSGALAQATEDHMVEFCAATLIVARDLPAYEAWKIRYAPDMAVVLKFQLMLQAALDSKQVRAQDVLEGAANCRDARDEEMLDGNQNE